MLDKRHFYGDKGICKHSRIRRFCSEYQRIFISHLVRYPVADVSCLERYHIHEETSDLQHVKRSCLSLIYRAFPDPKVRKASTVISDLPDSWDLQVCLVHRYVNQTFYLFRIRISFYILTTYLDTYIYICVYF